VQAQAMQAVLQRVQELVIAHANVPSNAKHWSAVLETASEKMQGKASKVKEYEKELAQSMSKLTQARAEMLALAASEEAKGGEAPGADDAQEQEPRSPSQKAASPIHEQREWLQAEEENTSTPASPLLDPPTRSGDPRVGLPPRSMSSKISGKRHPPVEYTPRGRLVEAASPPRAKTPSSPRTRRSGQGLPLPSTTASDSEMAM
jgi:hypothetical protein